MRVFLTGRGFSNCTRKKPQTGRLYKTLSCAPASSSTDTNSRWTIRRPKDVGHVGKWQRGLKTSSSITIPAAHQGLLPTAPAASALTPDDAPTFPQVIQQALNNIVKFSHCVVLTHVGSFYELYFQQAREYGPLLNLKIGKKHTNAGTVPMAGFPDYQLDRMLKILVQDLNKHVAISEQFENDAETRAKSGGLMHNRRVSRIITPGTLIDEKFMDPYENNFLLSIVEQPNASHGLRDSAHGKTTTKPVLGIAWLDLSSGDFFVQETDLSNLSAILARIAPREVLIDESLCEVAQVKLAGSNNTYPHVLTYVNLPRSAKQVQGWLHDLEDDEKRSVSTLERAAGNTILHYINESLLDLKPRLQAPVRQDESSFMTLDENTVRALEIRETIRQRSFQGSLLHATRKTSTKSGARLLCRRLLSPSMDVAEINNRLDLVEELLRHEILHHSLTAMLLDTSDSLRLVQKFSLGRGDADDLLNLSSTISLTVNITDVLRQHIDSATKLRGSQDPVHQSRFAALLDRFELDNPRRLCTRVLNAIDEEKLMDIHRAQDREALAMLDLADEQNDGGIAAPPIRGSKAVRDNAKMSVEPDGNAGIKDGWIMKRTASQTLKQLHTDLDTLLHDQASLEASLRSQTGCGNLFLRWTPGLGHIVYVKGSARDKATVATLPTAHSVRSSKSTQCFYLADWTRLGDRIEKAKKRILGEEERIFRDLRRRVVRNIGHIRRNAAVLDEIDVACSSATLARERRLVRPILSTDNDLQIIGGRHLTVENGLDRQGRQFTSNDLEMSQTQRILLITGPNMGGKSTFLRQNAIIAILAQAGSYVPADYAKIGIIDKIFSRVGSADNLYEDQSTFMVEMLETAQILTQATPKSFVIMDEVGRGTTPEDGIAVGFTALHRLYHVNKSRVLFATHFHALTDMAAGAPGVACFCTDVAEDATDGSWSFVHKLRPGVNRESHALKVAKLAGLPDDAIEVANTVLVSLQSRPGLLRPQQRICDLSVAGGGRTDTSVSASPDQALLGTAQSPLSVTA